MADAPKILFIDAATYFGWAYGPAGSAPISGSRYFAKGSGASRGAIFAGAMRFIAEMIQEHGTDIHIFIEAPLPTILVQGSTNIDTSEILMGIPAALWGMAYTMGCYNVQLCRVSAIRKHFIGKNSKGEIAKPLVMQKCIKLGWIKMGDEDMKHDRSDALAGWSYAEHQIAPRLSQPIDDLFLKRGGRIQ